VANSDINSIAILYAKYLSDVMNISLALDGKLIFFVNGLDADT